MKHFDETLNNSSRVVVGKNIPKSALNLGYLQIPSINTNDSLEIIDYSNKTIENNKAVVSRDITSYQDDNGFLSKSNGNLILPVRDVNITDKYYISAKDKIPLYYIYVAKHNYYNEVLSQELNVGDVIEYNGNEIMITENSEPVTKQSKPYRIFLKYAGNNEFELKLYTSFVCSEDMQYLITYPTFRSGNTVKQKEILNATYIFSESEVLTDSTYQAIEATNNEGFKFKLLPKTNKITRSPKLIRYRITYNDGTSTKHTDYIVTTILSKDSILDIDYKDEFGKTVYVKDTDLDGNVTLKKILFDKVSDDKRINAPFSSIDILLSNLQVHDGTDWVANNDLISIVRDSSQQRIYAVINESTGYVVEENDVSYYKKRLNAVTKIAITGRAYPTTPYKPSTTRNVLSDEYLESMTATPSSGNIKYSDNLADIILPAIPGSLRPVLSGGYFGFYTDDYTVKPSYSLPTITFRTKSIHDFERIVIKMGRYGYVSSIRMIDANSTNIPVGSPVDGVYDIQLATKVSASGFVITFTPTTVKSVDYNFILNWLGIGDKYRDQVSIYSVQAYETTEAVEANEWRETNIVEFSTSNANIYKGSLANLIETYGPTPPENFKDKTEYRIDTIDNGKEISDYRCNVFLHERTQSGYSMLSLDRWIPLNKLNDYNLLIKSDVYDVYKSPLYSVSSSYVESIFVAKPHINYENEPWPVYINNGRNTTMSFEDGKSYKNIYFIREFAMQAFGDEFPYMREELEDAIFVDSKIIKVKNTPMYVTTINGEPDNLLVTVNGRDVEIETYDVANGYIYLKSPVRMEDRIRVTYSYKQKYFVYRGYHDGTRMNYLDLNPLPGHIYTGSNGEDEPSSNLVNKDIYIYMLPVVKIPDDGLTPEVTHDGSTVRHIIVDKNTPYLEVVNEIKAITPNLEPLILAKINIVNKITENNIVFLDGRTLGGGIKEGVSADVLKQINDELLYFNDIGSLDGIPYPNNCVLYITLPKKLITTEGYTEEEIEQLVKKYIAFGVYFVIRYV